MTGTIFFVSVLGLFSLPPLFFCLGLLDFLFVCMLSIVLFLNVLTILSCPESFGDRWYLNLINDNDD